MQTNLDVANSALFDLNIPELMSFDDPSKEARVIKAKFQSVLDRVLCSNAWVCNRSFIVLNKAPTTMLNGWDYAFTLPNDNLFTRAVVPVGSLTNISAETFRRLSENSGMQRSDSLYMLADGKVYSNSENVILVYSKQIKDCTKLPSYVITPIVKLLAAEVAYPITEDRQLRMDQLGLYAEELKIARATNAREENTAVPIPTLILVR